MFPKNKSLRSKTITVNTKKVNLTPWSNTQLVEFESQIEDNPKEYQHDLVYEYLIKPNIETSKKLTLLDEQIILFELYKLSKSNSLDLVYFCNSCETEKCNVNVKLDNITNIKQMNISRIKTESYIFNLKRYSNYRIDFKKKDNQREVLKYLASFIESFVYNKQEFPVDNLDEFVDYLSYEMHPQSEFDSLLKQFNESKPDMSMSAEVICEYCGAKQTLNLKLIDFLV